MEKDVSWSEFLSVSERFADVVNCFGCNGTQYVEAKDIYELDSKVSFHLFQSKKQKAFSKARDILRRVAFGIHFVIIGVETQDPIDYAYPLRELGYTYGEYEKQAGKIRRNVRKGIAAGAEELTAGELLYRFRKVARVKFL